MGKINLDKEVEERIGYKVIYKRDNKYYSFYTEQEMNIGDVEPPPLKFVDEYTKFGMFNPEYVGYTGVFKEFKHALQLKHHFRYREDLVIVKIEFTEDAKCYIGNYYNREIIVGNKIKSIIDF